MNMLEVEPCDRRYEQVPRLPGPDQRGQAVVAFTVSRQLWQVDGRIIGDNDPHAPAVQCDPMALGLDVLHISVGERSDSGRGERMFLR